MLKISGCSPILPPSGIALLHCPGEVQGLFSQVLQLVGDRDISSDLVTSGPVLTLAPGINGQLPPHIFMLSQVDDRDSSL